ncbi:MAG: DUF7178 family protein, partial [Bacteroidota bacterium]
LGMRWYPEALATAYEIAGESGYTVEQVAGVIAAVSPNTSWQQNVSLAWQLCVEGRDGGTFGKNVAYAHRILTGEVWEDVLKGPKVRAFAANILGDTQRVTVDRWMARAAGLNIDRVNVGQYVMVEQAVREGGAAVGVSPRDLQAMVWITIRERR